MRSIRIMLFRTLALILAMSVGQAGMASASANHSSHCVPATERADAGHAASDIQNSQNSHDRHSHVAAEAEATDVGTMDCQPHFCADVLIGLAGCGAVSHKAMLMVVPEPANLRALARILGLYRPPSL